MKRRATALCLSVLAGGALATSTCNPPAGVVVQTFERRAGHVEPHTPGSGDPAEMPRSANVVALLGAGSDLNQVDYVRTRWDNGSGAPPRAIVVLIPGFLGGATTFDPIARDLVAKFNGGVEVWAVDRRPNQLEDRLGARFAFEGAIDPPCAVPPQPSCSIFVGAQFYSPDQDSAPMGDFPGPGDLDLDLDGVLDPQGQLEDDFGVTRGPVLIAQNDVRFMAYWGLDTYFRDWKLLIEDARAVVGASGVVLLGGHSQGTSWASTFAAYDFDPNPGVTVAGYSLVDGLLLLEGGGAGTGQATKPTLAQYQATVASLDDAGGPEVFLSNFSGIPLQSLGTSGEVSAIAGFFHPNEPAMIQRTPTFGTGTIGLLLSAPSSNRALGGLFLDDDFSPIGAFRASLGFTDNGPNQLVTNLPGFAPFYLAAPATGGGLRQWKEYNDPTLPTCPPNVANVSPGCALLDNGPPSDPLNPADPARANGDEVEVTSLTDFFMTQFGKGNGFEWYFSSGRPNLDFAYGRDSSVLVAESLALDPNDEGPLVITQNAAMNVPVLAIGGSNGLTPEPKSFTGYLSSIATPAADKQVVIVEGYAHLDVINATNNGALPPIVAFVNELIQRKLLAMF
jgi:pimeloyl-ACP methyl ester carboxylesterase